MNDVSPIEIKKIDNSGIEIVWSDGLKCFLSSRTLRENCPSALSQEKRGDTSHSKPLSTKKPKLMVLKNDLETELDLKEIWGVGNYALGIRFGDGHDTGIYSFSLLRKLSI